MSLCRDSPVSGLYQFPLGFGGGLNPFGIGLLGFQSFIAGLGLGTGRGLGIGIGLGVSLGATLGPFSWNSNGSGLAKNTIPDIA